MAFQCFFFTFVSDEGICKAQPKIRRIWNRKSAPFPILILASWHLMRLDLIVFRIKVSKTKPNTSFSTPPNKAIRFCSINVPWVSYQNIWHFKRETVWRSHCTTWESEERHWHIENRSAHSITNQLGSSICPRFSSSLQLSCFISRSVILP